jgi:hypothetical protein
MKWPRMRSWEDRSSPDEKRQLKDSQKRGVLRFFHKKDRPLLIGEIALHMNLHLEVVTDLLEEMVTDGTIRHPTAAEINLQDRYILVGPASARLAGDDR